MFKRVMNRYPLQTQCITCALLFGAGDVITQTYFPKPKTKSSFDFSRTFRLLFFGGFVAGPSMTLWYRFLNKHIVFSSPTKQLVTRVALDQLLFSPTFLLIFFSFNGIVEGKGRDEIIHRLELGYKKVLIGNWTIWPLVQLVNFKFVPLNYQTVMVNTVALGWNTYLNLVNQEASRSSEGISNEIVA
jgi:protein Mpv17